LYNISGTLGVSPVGQVANLRADWQSAQPGNARPFHF
jgi:hypothetical protein